MQIPSVMHILRSIRIVWLGHLVPEYIENQRFQPKRIKKALSL